MSWIINPLRERGGVSISVVEAIAQAIFKVAPSLVVEAYSTPGAEPLRFQGESELIDYAEALREFRGGTVFIKVHYPDMSGGIQTRRIELNPQYSDGGFRFITEGWGLISVYLPVAESARLTAHVSANSERRALSWEATVPELAPVSCWNWKSVESHERRLKRALKKAI